MANQTALGVSTNNILTPGYPLVGGDAPGTNLTIRSTSHPTKGTVIVDEYTASYGSNSGALQTLGGIGAQHNVSVGGALYNLPYGYSVTNVVAPQGGGGYYPGFSQIVPVTGTSISGTTATISYPTQTLQNTLSATTTTIIAAAYGTLTATNTTGSFTIGTAQSAGTFVVGQLITITGTPNTTCISGYSSGSTYVISATNGTSTFTLQYPGYTPITTVATAVTGLTLAINGYNQLSITNNSGGLAITTTGLPQNTFAVGQLVNISGTISTPTIVNGTTLTASLAPIATLSDGSTNLFSINASSVITLATNSSTALFVGQQIKITGTFSTGSITSYTTGNVYFITQTNGTNQFTISATVGGGAVGSTASTGNITGVTITYGNVFTLNTPYVTNLLTVGQAITLTNALSTGVLNASGTTTSSYGSGPTTFYIAATNGTNQFSLAASSGGTVLAANASSGNFTSAAPTITQNPINGYTNSTTYVITATNGTSTMTLYSTSGTSIITTSAAGTALTSAQYTSLTASTGGVFTLGSAQSAGAFQVGMTLTITGTQAGAGSIGNYTSGNIYTIVATNGTSTFTLYQNGLPITTTAGAITGLTLTTQYGLITGLTLNTYYVPFLLGQQVTVSNNSGGYNGTYSVAGVTTSSITVSPSLGSGSTTTGFISTTQFGGPTVPNINITNPILAGGATAGATAQMIGINLQTTAASGTGSVATLTYSSQTYPPFYVGQVITVSNIIPTGYQGTYVVTACTTTTVSYASATSGSQTGVGVISSQGIQQIAISNPGTGYLSPPLVNFQDPSPVIAQLYTASLVVATGQYVKAIQSTSGTGTSSSLIFFYYVYAGGTMSATQPTTTTGFIVSGTAILIFIGSNAQAYSVLGYTGIITQGSLVQMGCISSGVIVAQGSNYTSAPIVTFSKPDMPGGRLPYATVTVSSGAITGFNVEDPGSGYLNPPVITLTNVGTNTAGSGGNIVAVLANPGEKAIVSNMPSSYNNNYWVDFGQTGNNVVFITLSSGTTSNLYFDFTTATSGASGSGATPYEHAFPLGRRVIVYIKNLTGGTNTMTFQNLQSVNSNSGANTLAVGSNTTRKVEFAVLTTSNVQSGLASAPGGHANDVFAFIT
jgi:hypothetical protein